MHTQRYALAAAITAGAIYSIIALTLLYAREKAFAFLGNVLYMESLTPLSSHIIINTKIFLSGLAQIMIYSYLAFLLFGLIARLFHCHAGRCGSGDHCGCTCNCPIEKRQ